MSGATLEVLFQHVCLASFNASLLLAAILVLFLLFRRLSPSWRVALTGLVFLRLAFLFTPESAYSIANWFPAGDEGGWFAIEPGAGERGIEPVVVGPATVDIETMMPQAGSKDQAGQAFPWLLLVSGVWLFGFIGLLLLACLRQRAFYCALVSHPLSELDSLQVELMEKLNLRKGPLPVFTSSEFQSPALVGLLRPKLVLPSEFETIYSRTEQADILLHELAHLKRRDLWWSALVQLLCALHWFNPFVWMTGRSLRRELELCCDTLVLKSLGDSEARQRYGRLLLKVAEHLHVQKPSVASAFFIHQTPNIERRVKMILTQTKTTTRVHVLLGLTTLALFLATFTGAIAEERTKPAGSFVGDTFDRMDQAFLEKLFEMEDPGNGYVEGKLSRHAYNHVQKSGLGDALNASRKNWGIALFQTSERSLGKIVYTWGIGPRVEMKEIIVYRDGKTLEGREEMKFGLASHLDLDTLKGTHNGTSGGEDYAPDLHVSSWDGVDDKRTVLRPMGECRLLFPVVSPFAE